MTSISDSGKGEEKDGHPCRRKTKLVVAEQLQSSAASRTSALFHIACLSPPPADRTWCAFLLSSRSACCLFRFRNRPLLALAIAVSLLLTTDRERSSAVELRELILSREIGGVLLFFWTVAERGVHAAGVWRSPDSLSRESRTWRSNRGCIPLKRAPRRARNIMPKEYVEQDGFYNHSTRSKRYRDNKNDLERQSSPVRKKPSTRRASCESKGSHDIPGTNFDGHDHRGTGRELKEEKSSSGNDFPKELVRDHGPTASGVQSHSLASLSPAKVLLTQQGCLNYSEIVSKRREGYVTDEARSRPLMAATMYAAGLKNQSFLVVMKDHHVYHGFQLSIPSDFLEATGSLIGTEVPVWLMDPQRNCYDTKWKWHACCQKRFLNCDGWALFALDHMLEEGDVCVFELVGPGPAFLFYVHFFKIVTAEIKSERVSLIHGGFERPTAAAADNADQKLIGLENIYSRKERAILDKHNAEIHDDHGVDYSDNARESSDDESGGKGKDKEDDGSFDNEDDTSSSTGESSDDECGGEGQDEEDDILYWFDRCEDDTPPSSDCGRFDWNLESGSEVDSDMYALACWDDF